MTMTEESYRNALADSESGEYERHFAITRGSVVLDIGAHVGYFSALACRKGAFVIALEPHPKNFKSLNERLRSAKAIAVNKAASNFTGCATLYECPSNSGAHSLFKHGQCSDVTHDVGVVDIGEFAARLSPDFIKIDTEGSEVAILESLFRYGIRASMAIECHDSSLYERCRALAEDNGRIWLPETVNVGVCYC